MGGYYKKRKGLWPYLTSICKVGLPSLYPEPIALNLIGIPIVNPER